MNKCELALKVPIKDHSRELKMEKELENLKKFNKKLEKKLAIAEMCQELILTTQHINEGKGK